MVEPLIQPIRPTPLGRWGQLSGAVAGSDDAGNACILHYGSFLTEQRALAAGTALVYRSNRSVFCVRGADRASWLHSLTSQKCDLMAPGLSYETLVLDAQGHIRFVLGCVDDGVQTWIWVDHDQEHAVMQWLNSMRFMLDVRVEYPAEAVYVVGRMDQVDTRVSNQAQSVQVETYVSEGVPIVWHDPWARVAEGGYQYATVQVHPGSAWTWSEYVVSAATLENMREDIALGACQVAGHLAWEALRIRAWRPTSVNEVDEKSFPHEFDWLRSAVHLNKGCYCGQESVAKIHNLGHPPRRLVMLHLDGSEGILPAKGDGVFVDTKQVGFPTSAAVHYEYGPFALALVKRRTSHDTLLYVEHAGMRIPASQETIAPCEAGATANIPKDLPHHLHRRK